MITLEIKTKWVAALRSGKYKQGRSRLRKFDEYCCLGVLCDVIDPTAWTLDKAITGLYAWRNKEHFPTDSFSSGNDHTLSMKNDFGKESFEKLANWIEEKVQTEEIENA